MKPRKNENGQDSERAPHHFPASLVLRISMRWSTQRVVRITLIGHGSSPG